MSKVQTIQINESVFGCNESLADATGIRSLQIHNGGGLCHIDAEMTLKAIEEQIKAVR